MTSQGYTLTLPTARDTPFVALSVRVQNLLSPDAMRIPVPLVVSLVATSLAALSNCASAQKWQLPPGSAAVYQQTPRWESEPLDGQKWSWEGGHAHYTVPILFGGELDKTRRTPRRTPFSLQTIWPYVAFDLSTLRKRKVRVILPRVSPFGDVVLVGDAGAVDQEGRQTLRLKVSRRPADTGEEGLDRSMEHYMPCKIEGSMEIVRRFDRDQGLVTGFTVTMDVVAEAHSGDGKHRFHIKGSETWEFERVRTADAEFHQEVRKAVDEAVAYVRNRLDKKDSTAFTDDEAPGPLHGPAYHAHLLRALAAQGIGFEDPLVKESYEELLDRDFRHQRALSEAMLAMADLHGSPLAERRTRRVRGAVLPPRRSLPAKEKRLMTKWARMLVQSADPSVDPTRVLRWSFRDKQRGFSTFSSALATEALFAAESCGVPVPDTAWRAIARHFIDSQHPGFGPGDRPWTEDRKRRTVDLAAGWNSGPEWGGGANKPQGHTTASTMAALAGVRLRLTSRRDKALVKEIDQALARGAGWLAHFYEPRIDPSLHSVHWQDHSEWTGVLALAAERSQIQKLDGQDWYFPMALTLLHLRKSTGATGRSVGGTPGALFLWFPGPSGPLTGPRRTQGR